MFDYNEIIEQSSDLGGVKVIPEGSGVDVKYYAQLGADSASKKLLGSSIYLGTARGTFKTLTPMLEIPYTYDLSQSDAKYIRFVVNPESTGIFMGSVEQSSNVPWMGLNSYNITIDTEHKTLNITMTLNVPWGNIGNCEFRCAFDIYLLSF